MGLDCNSVDNGMIKQANNNVADIVMEERAQLCGFRAGVSPQHIRQKGMRLSHLKGLVQRLQCNT